MNLGTRKAPTAHSAVHTNAVRPVPVWPDRREALTMAGRDEKSRARGGDGGMRERDSIRKPGPGPAEVCAAVIILIPWRSK